MPASRTHNLSDWGKEVDARLRAAHVTKAALAQQLRLHPSTLFRWLQSEPPTTVASKRVERILEELEGTRPTLLADTIAGHDSDPVAQQLRDLRDDLHRFRRRVASEIADGAETVPISDVVYWVNRVLSVTEATITARDGVVSMIGLLPVAFYNVGADLRIRWVSAGATMLFGWAPDEIMAQGALSFIHPDDVARTSDAIGELQTTGTYDPFDVRIRCRDGTYRSVTARAVAMLDEQDELKGFITSLSPISTDHTE